MAKDLRVDIPEEFKNQLMDRFTPSPSEKRVARIDIPCPLCEKFGSKHCEDCPFEQFKASSVAGCEVWIMTAIGGGYDFVCMAPWICWEVEDEDIVFKQLSLLRERAKELITWTC